MNTSTGVKIAYPMGAIVATASYVMEAMVTVRRAGALACTQAGDHGILLQFGHRVPHQ